MLQQAVVAYIHFSFIFLSIGLLVAETFTYRQVMTYHQARRLILIDALYGLSAIGIAVSGFARALWFAKGWEFYGSNPVFWALALSFGVWAVLSIVPTLHYMSWLSDVKKKIGVTVTSATEKRVRKYFYLQFIMAAIAPLLACVVAKGIGLTP